MRLALLSWLGRLFDTHPDYYSIALRDGAVTNAYARRAARAAALADKYRNGKNGGLAALAKYASELEDRLDQRGVRHAGK